MTELMNKSTCHLHDDIWQTVFSFLSGTDLRFVAQVGQSFWNTAKTRHRLVCSTEQTINGSQYFIPKQIYSVSFNSDGTLLAYWDDEDKEFVLVSVKRSTTVSRIKASGSRPDLISFSENSEFLAGLCSEYLLIFRICPPRGKHGFQELYCIRNIGMDKAHSGLRAVQFSMGKNNTASVKLAELSLALPDDTYFISFSELDLDDSDGSRKSVLRTVHFRPSVSPEAPSYDLRDISFSSSSNKLYVSPAGLGTCSGQIFSIDQGHRRPVPLHNSRLGVLLGATFTPCGTYFLELRRLKSVYILRKIDAGSFKEVNVAKLERYKNEACLGFMANSSVALVLLGNHVEDELGTHVRKCRISGWIVYDTRSSQAVFTTMKGKKKELYQAGTESIVLSQDGQLLGLVPLRRDVDQECELQIFYASTGWLKQAHKRVACSKRGMHLSLHNVKCTCLSRISSYPEVSVSTVSVGCNLSTVFHSYSG